MKFRLTSQPLSPKTIIRIQSVLIIVLAVTAGYFFVRLQAQQRVSEVWKKRYEQLVRALEA